MIFEFIDIHNNQDPINTNNYEHDIHGNIVSAQEYREKYKNTLYDKIVDFLPFEIKAIPMTNSEKKLLCELSSVGQYRGFVSDSLLNEHLEDLTSLIKKISENMQHNEKYFIRLNECSPKDSVIGCCVTTVMDVIKSICGSQRCNKAFAKPDSCYGRTIYMLPWNPNINERYEFRTFCNKKLTAISQYNPYGVYEWSDCTENYWETLVSFCKEQIAKIIEKTKIDNFTLDVFYLPNSEPQIIEMNSFGMEMAAGSCLFEWKRDSDLLYGKKDHLVIRLAE